MFFFSPSAASCMFHQAGLCGAETCCTSVYFESQLPLLVGDLFAGRAREPEHPGPGLPPPRSLRAGPPGLRRAAHPKRGEREYSSLRLRSLLAHHTRLRRIQGLASRIQSPLGPQSSQAFPAGRSENLVGLRPSRTGFAGEDSLFFTKVRKVNSGSC